MDDGSCIIYGCTINAWYICPDSYNPDATVNDWGDCVFVWEGCSNASIEILDPDEYPFMQLYDVTEDVVDAYYYLGPDRIGCMDISAVNYLKTAVLDDNSCIYSTLNSYSNLENNQLLVYPQPATSNITIDIIADDILDTTELVIYNVLGEQIYTTEIVANTSINLDINSWKPGVYSVVVNMKDNNLVYRFIVE